MGNQPANFPQLPIVITNCHHHCIVSISNRHHHCVASFLSLSSTVSLSTVSRPSPSSHRSCCKTKDPGPLENLSLNASYAQSIHMQMSNISIFLDQRLKQNGTPFPRGFRSLPFISSRASPLGLSQPSLWGKLSS